MTSWLKIKHTLSHTVPTEKVCYNCIIIILGQEWGSVAQENDIYLTLAPPVIRIIHFWWLSWDLSCISCSTCRAEIIPPASHVIWIIKWYKWIQTHSVELYSLERWNNDCSVSFHKAVWKYRTPFEIDDMLWHFLAVHLRLSCTVFLFVPIWTQHPFLASYTNDSKPYRELSSVPQVSNLTD